ncbi:Cys/Met metabolism, pyridoxal phosphate-dependent enzyme, partial [mine drainage metagenome]
MKFSGESAYNIAKKLSTLSGMEKVIYPGLEDHPDYALASKQLNGFGSVVSFVTDRKRVDPEKFMKALKIVTPANTLGGVNTTISHPATMSHRSLSAEEKKMAGINESLFRLSVGLEDPGDIL